MAYALCAYLKRAHAMRPYMGLKQSASFWGMYHNETNFIYAATRR